MPEFPKGTDQMFAFIRAHIHYPDAAVNEGLEGRVMIAVVIDTDGSVTQPSVYKSVAPSLDSEAVRVISSMPRWTAGMQDDRLVRTRYFIPVVFKLETPAEPNPGQDNRFPLFGCNVDKYIADNLSFPAKAKVDKVEGTLMIKVLIDENGRVKDATVISPVNPILDNRILDLIKRMPRWTPGEKNGKKAACYCILPFNIRQATRIWRDRQRKWHREDNPFKRLPLIIHHPDYPKTTFYWQ